MNVIRDIRIPFSKVRTVGIPYFSTVSTEEPEFCRRALILSI